MFVFSVGEVMGMGRVVMGWMGRQGWNDGYVGLVEDGYGGLVVMVVYIDVHGVDVGWGG